MKINVSRAELTQAVAQSMVAFQNRVTADSVTLAKLRQLQQESIDFFSLYAAAAQESYEPEAFTKLDADLNAAHALAVRVAKTMLQKESEIALMNDDIVVFP